MKTETPQPRHDPYEAVTDLILEHLERGTVPWRCPWDRATGRPANFETTKPYRGINSLLLGMRSLNSPWWLTFRQAQALGGCVRKGERGTHIVKYGTFQRAEDASANAEAADTREARPRGYLRSFTVFNATQIEGIVFPPLPGLPPLREHERIERAEGIMKGIPHPPAIREEDSARACYSPVTDTITMPPMGRFESADAFYLTLFHETVHSSGHPSRLARDSLLKYDGFGGPDYSREELVAEIGAAFLGMEAGIVADRHEQSAAYLKGWLDALRAKEHRRWIVTAAAQAAKAADYVLCRKTETAPGEAI